MDLNVLRTFVAVCEYAGFSAAGERLGYTQSTVSSQIRQLEKELGVRLFDRLYHRTELTEDGRLALSFAREVLTSHDRLHAALHRPDEVRGQVRLAMPSSVCAQYFGAAFLEFRRKYPAVRVTITEAGTTQMFDMLRKNEADLVITLDSHIYDPEFCICAEREEGVHFVAAAGNPIGASGPLTAGELLRAPFAATEKGMSYGRLLDEQLAARSMALTPVLELGNSAQLCSLVASSDLIAFLPDYVTQESVASGRLKRLTVRDVDVTVWTQLLIHKSKWRSPALAAFLTFYADRIADA